MKELVRTIAEQVYPHGYRCVVCGREIDEYTPYSICEACGVEWNTGRVCERCGREVRNEAQYCEQCMRTERSFELARSAVVYRGSTVRLVRGLKFGRRRYLARTINEISAKVFGALEWTFDVVIPVPLSAKRLKHRGYNQAELLARAISEASGVPMRDDVLYKIRDIAYQARLSAKERAANIKGCFAMVDDGSLKGKRILLVDDVMTTGATVEECCEVLRKLRPDRIYVWTFASTPQHVLRPKRGKSGKRERASPSDKAPP